MKQYLLLRNNAQTGPFNLTDLCDQQLHPADLIWVDGQSTAWKHPAELYKLQVYTTDKQLTAAKIYDTANTTSSNTPRHIFTALPSQWLPPRLIYKSDLLHLHQQNCDNNISNHIILNNATIAQSAVTRNIFKTFSKPHIGLSNLSFFIGLLVAAWLMIGFMHAYNENTVHTLAATAHPVFNKKDVDSPDAGLLYQNALTTELIAIDTVTMHPVKKAGVKVNLRRLVRLETNDYQVSILKGIEKLRLLVTNKSGFTLNKINIELHYLKSNGDVIKTDHLVMKSVKPNSHKSLAVSSFNRGAKVVSYITDIQSSEEAENLISL